MNADGESLPQSGTVRRMRVNYDRMLELNRDKSERKVRQAMEAIDEMRATGERISVLSLASRTGLSRGFFYANPRVRTAVRRAMCEQEATYGELREAVGRLEREMARVKSENERLAAQNRCGRRDAEER